MSDTKRCGVHYVRTLYIEMDKKDTHVVVLVVLDMLTSSESSFWSCLSSGVPTKAIILVSWSISVCEERQTLLLNR